MAPLETYRRKRNFEVTKEPRGKAGKKGGHAFVAQKHAARRLHYDFRLELDGVLKSWALAKGPSLVPGERRLAVHVEDHPLDYGGFEGRIPQGQYGGGAVMVWDRGTWTPKDDPRAGLKKGHLDFTLDGEKLKGAWHLVRMRAKAGDRGDNWLLIKADDAAARSADEADILDEAPLSVLTQRSIEAITGEEKAKQSRSKSGAGTAKNSGRKTKHRRAAAPAELRAKPQPATHVRLSHPDRVFWPEAGITKQDLADYYLSVWPYMERHVSGRPLALVRCPAGITESCFFQKHEWNGMDAKVKRIVDPHDGQAVVGIEDLDGLIALVQASVLEIHPWGARMQNLDHPDRLIFDLDPGPGVAFGALAAAARRIRDRLKAESLESFVKTTGGKGLHVVAPLEPTADWDAVKGFSRAIAAALAREDPGHFTATAAKSRRGGRIYVDYLRNARGATAVCAYSTRARPKAGIATPLAWDELDDLPAGDHFTLGNLARRLAHLKADPWADFFTIRQHLPKPAQAPGTPQRKARAGAS